MIEPDVSPLAIQGPLAKELVADLFGDWVKELTYFGFKQTELQGIPLVLARSGWSKQGGYELYLQDGARGVELWNIVKSKGAAFGIRPGAPNDLERIESGLVSYGADGRLQANPCNPFEISLGKLVDFDKADAFIGKAALQKIKKKGAKRRRVGFVISGAPVPACQHSLDVKTANGKTVGVLSEFVFSNRFSKNIGVGMIAMDIGNDAADLVIQLNEETRQIAIEPLPFSF